ncbi:hypothetical protein ATE40_003765 [Serratia surfactantfaciens]|nr:hypothetical protein ATE40_003765 [Serratia surfactantfaciens]
MSIMNMIVHNQDVISISVHARFQQDPVTLVIRQFIILDRNMASATNGDRFFSQILKQIVLKSNGRAVRKAQSIGMHADDAISHGEVFTTDESHAGTRASGIPPNRIGIFLCRLSRNPEILHEEIRLFNGIKNVDLRRIVIQVNFTTAINMAVAGDLQRLPSRTQRQPIDIRHSDLAFFYRFSGINSHFSEHGADSFSIIGQAIAHGAKLFRGIFSKFTAVIGLSGGIFCVEQQIFF